MSSIFIYKYDQDKLMNKTYNVKKFNNILT